MGFLKGLFLASILIALNAHAESNDFLPMIDGVDASLSGGVGTGSNDYIGVGGAFYVGSDLDRKNTTGDFHFNYVADFSPEDSTVENSAEQRLTNWSGGFSADLWPKTTIGVDYDSTSDPFDQLDTEGLHLSLDCGPGSLGYRIARTTLEVPFQIDSTNPQNPPKDYLGAFIYQQTVDAGWRIKPSKTDTISIHGSVSFFNPDAADFATLLNKNSLSALGNLQSELQNFERWNAGFTWRHKYNDKWDSRLSSQFSHLVLGTNPLIMTTATGGYHWSEGFSTRLGAQYLYTPGQPITSVIFEARWSWIRDHD
jgi:hypothetical protein